MNNFSAMEDVLLDLRCANDASLGALRSEVRTFCAEALPPDIRRKVLLNEHLEKADHIRWQRLLHDAGLLVAHWPIEYGGRGWSRLQRWVFENEIYRAGSPWLVPFGITYVAPVIYTYGNDAQKRRWLAPTAESQIWWAQGYSESGAGSDLAQLSTLAVREGDHYVVTGHKTWTTMAQWADMLFTLVRTDPSARPQSGISFLLIDLKSPGVTVRPIATIDGEAHINEIFLDAVRVPVDQLIGSEGKGWIYAKFLLGNERLLAAEIGKAYRLIRRLDLLIPPDRGWQRRKAALEARILALESLSYDLLAQAEAGRDPGAMASVLKVLGSELMQSITGAIIDAVGRHGLVLAQSEQDCPAGDTGLPGGSGAVSEYLYTRAATIYGGSSEIQRNILAKTLGL